eukprot:11208914-Lingulodinium_polyedra.AAC.1
MKLRRPARIPVQALARGAWRQQIRTQDDASGEVCRGPADLNDADRTALGAHIPNRCRAVARREEANAL